MDIRKIKKLIELLEESSLTEMEIVEGEESVRLSRGGSSNPGVAHHFMPAPMHAPVPPPAAAAPSPAPAPAQAAGEEAAVPDGNVVRSPMVGTFFSAPSPDASPFVSMGKQVTEEVVGLVPRELENVLVDAGSRIPDITHYALAGP